MTIRDLLIYTGLYRPYIKYEFLPDENNIEVLNFYPTDLQQLWHYRYVMHHFRDLVTPDNTQQKRYKTVLYRRERKTFS